MSSNLSRDRRALIRHLFAEATSVLETAQTIASRGQSHRLTAQEYLSCATRLHAAVNDAAALVAAVRVLIRPSVQGHDG